MSVIQVKLPVVVSFDKESVSFVAYSPALELATQGESIEEAKEMFDEAFSLFLEELITTNTLASVLKDIGWNIGETATLPVNPIQEYPNKVLEEQINLL